MIKEWNLVPTKKKREYKLLLLSANDLMIVTLILVSIISVD